MIRLNVVVEGQTEEAFGNRVLSPYFSELNIFPVFQLITGSGQPRPRTHKGGWNSYQAVKSHLTRWMKQDRSPDVWFTTMLDLYAIPTDFPGYHQSPAISEPHPRVAFLEKNFLLDMESDARNRFIPYLQLHEFEALIFSHPRSLDWEFLEHEDAIERLSSLAHEFDSPEHINGGFETAPSKRIIKEIPAYEHRKVSAGPLVADKIGLSTLKENCRHFREWLHTIEEIQTR